MRWRSFSIFSRSHLVVYREGLHFFGRKLSERWTFVVRWCSVFAISNVREREEGIKSQRGIWFDGIVMVIGDQMDRNVGAGLQSWIGDIAGRWSSSLYVVSELWMLEEECYLVWENVVGYHCVDWCSVLCYALFSIVSDCLSLWFLSFIINVGMWWCGML